MKKVFLALSFAILGLFVNAQVDAAFTAKLINVENTAKAYYQSQTPANLQAAIDAARAFHPMTNAQFSSKLSATLNSSGEMAKFTGPIGFVQCIGTAAGQYNSCIRNLPYDCWLDEDGDELCDLPEPSAMAACDNNYQSAIIHCAITHLTR